jgi:hypothetical protein
MLHSDRTLPFEFKPQQVADFGLALQIESHDTHVSAFQVGLTGGVSRLTGGLGCLTIGVALPCTLAFASARAGAVPGLRPAEAGMGGAPGRLWRPPRSAVDGPCL